MTIPLAIASLARGGYVSNQNMTERLSFNNNNNNNNKDVQTIYFVQRCSL